MRVLHVINDLAVGGAETVLYRLATYPSDTQHEVICIESRAAYSEQLERRGISVHHLEWASLAASPGAWLRLVRLIKLANADIVQTWMYRSNIVGGLAAKRSKVPVVWNIRCSSVAPLRPASRILARVGGYLTGVVPSRIVNCSVASAEIHKQLGYDPADVVVIANGYDSEAYCPDEHARQRTRKQLGIGAETFAMGAIGRWDPAKGYPVLLKAMRQLADRGLNFRLLLIGPGLESSNAELSRLIEKAGCGNFVRTLGYRADVPDLARAMDLHVLASLTEGFPNVIAETMLSGTPNVATDVGDSAIIVGSSGWTVPVGDAERLADAIEQAHSEWGAHTDLWRDRQEAARRHIAENFALDQMVKAYEKIWEQVARGDGLS